jgi:predicted RNA binding protein YcfA (HicA-like mRNA interferase family)
MPKLPSLTPQRVIRILEDDGFVLDRVKGSHHIYYHPQTRKRAIVPVHKKDLPKGTLLEILKQAGITKKELRKILGSRD